MNCSLVANHEMYQGTVGSRYTAARYTAELGITRSAHGPKKILYVHFQIFHLYGTRRSSARSHDDP